VGKRPRGKLSGVKAIKPFYSSLTLRQNKLDRVALAFPSNKSVVNVMQYLGHHKEKITKDACFNENNMSCHRCHPILPRLPGYSERFGT